MPEPEINAQDGLSPKELAAVRDPFQFHKVSEACAKELAAIRGAFRKLRDFLRTEVTDCRHRSIAITHLEDASRAAITAAVLSHPDSEPVEE
jgi:hypothetical protein